MSASAHTPVLLEEVVQALNLPQSHIVVDATYGRGGHSAAIAKRLDGNSRLIVMDRDAEAIQHAIEHFSSYPAAEKTPQNQKELHLFSRTLRAGPARLLIARRGRE